MGFFPLAYDDLFFFVTTSPIIILIIITTAHPNLGSSCRDAADAEIKSFLLRARGYQRLHIFALAIAQKIALHASPVAENSALPKMPSSSFDFIFLTLKSTCVMSDQSYSITYI